jgi:hypothetical protein
VTFEGWVKGVDAVGDVERGFPLPRRSVTEMGKYEAKPGLSRASLKEATFNGGEL